MTLAHAICPKLKPWMDDADRKPHPCRQCGPFDTNYGKAIPACLAAAQEIASAVAAHMLGDEVVERAARAAWRNEGGPAWETCGDNYRALVRAALAAALGKEG